MKITITAEVQPEDADPSHSTGVTNEFFEKLTDFDTGLPAMYGLEDVTIEKAEEL